MKLLFYICLCITRISWAQNIESNKIYLSPQTNTLLQINPGQAIKVRGKKILQIDDLGTKIRITALQLGTVQIVSGTKIYDVSVVNKNQIAFFKSLKNRLGEWIGPEAEIQNGLVTITGKIHRLSDWQDIENIAREFGSNFQIQAQLDAEVKSAAKVWIADVLQSQNLAIPHIIFEPLITAILPEEDKPISTLWEQALFPLGIKIQYEKSQLSIQPLVRVRIVVAEVNKKMQTQLGVEWPNMISATISPKLKSIDSLELFLKAMEQNGLGQILASPNLLARSGSEADFLAGGEFGIKIVTGKTKEVVWKRHGIYLKIKPQADRAGRLSIELSTEISIIDASQAVDGVPALKTNRMSTHFDLSQPRTIVLSGLIRQDWGQSRGGVIGLAKIPIIGALFRSDDFFDNKTELVIFVTPEIVNEQESPQTALLPKNWITHE